MKEDWKKENPLRKHRDEHNVSQFMAAAALGVSAQTIQRWESGATIPTDENFVKLGEYIGDSPEAVKQSWKRWRDAVPGGVSHG